jgi:hypothetical protein
LEFVQDAAAFIALVLAGLAVVLLVLGVIAWSDDHDLTDHPPVEGLVQSVDDDGSGWGVVSYFVDGEQWETETDLLGHPVESSVLVVYDPEDPSYAYVQGDPGYAVSGWMLRVGVIVLVSAAFLFLLGVLQIGTPAPTAGGNTRRTRPKLPSRS